MPRKKTKSSKTTRSPRRVDMAMDRSSASESVPYSSNQSSKSGMTLKSKLMVLVILGLLVAFGLWKKELFVAAMVNGRPITRWQLDQALVKQYGAQTLDNMVSQKIAEQEVAKQGIVVGDKEVDDRINQISSTMPKGMTLDQALQMQGLDKAEFKKQIKLQLAIDKILAAKTTISDKEIDDYISSNAAQFKSVSPEAARDTAKKALEQQKGSAAFSAWFTSLKQSAKVLKFI